MISSIVQINDPFIQGKTDADQSIAKALHYLEARLHHQNDPQYVNSQDVSAYARLQLALEQEEIFAVMFLTVENRLIAFEKLFFGTIHEATVYPRKIVKKALQYNAAKVIIMHNHPSQECKPSQADKELTQMIKKILAIIDVILLDHIVVTSQKTYSFAEFDLL